MVAFTTDQVAALTTAQIVSLTTSQIVAMETADVAALTTAQIHALETADIAAVTTSQINALVSMTPIVLDLDGDGVQTTAAAHGVQFDLGGTGVSHQVGWLGGKDGLLVMDRNGDGSINDRRELFSAATVLANGQRAGNGYNAMAAEDSNHDGKLSAADTHFKDLKVWVDANHDGKTDAGELRGLLEAGVIELDLTAALGNEVNNGNLLGLVSSYKGADGNSHAVADVWFTKAQAAEPPQLGDLLAGPSADLLAGGRDDDRTNNARADAGPPLMQRASLDDDLRNSHLLL